MAEDKSPAVKPVRSVNFPAIMLTEAVELSKLLWESVGKNAVPQGTIASVWQYSEKSGSLRSAVAALRQYGLLDSTGWGDTKLLKLSSRALDLLIEPSDSPKYAAAAKAAAMAPALYAEIFARFPEGIPQSDHAISSFLLREKSFNRNSVPGFITAFRENLKFAHLTEPQTKPVGKDEIPRDKPIIEVGDLVQWEASGVLRLEAPRRIRAIAADGEWAFVDGSETGIPMAELILQEKGVGEKPLNPPPPTPPTMPLTAPIVMAGIPTIVGEREWLRGPLSRETNYRIIVSGEVGPKEIGKLIKLLEAQKLVLDDDEEED